MSLISYKRNNTNSIDRCIAQKKCFKDSIIIRIIVTLSISVILFIGDADYIFNKKMY